MIVKAGHRLTGKTLFAKARAAGTILHGRHEGIDDERVANERCTEQGRRGGFGTGSALQFRAVLLAGTAGAAAPADFIHAEGTRLVDGRGENLPSKASISAIGWCPKAICSSSSARAARRRSPASSTR